MGGKQEANKSLAVLLGSSADEHRPQSQVQFLLGARLFSDGEPRDFQDYSLDAERAPGTAGGRGGLPDYDRTLFEYRSLLLGHDGLDDVSARLSARKG